ncbi:hypothetical protein [Flavobacterium gillisiae]|uniref:hypothetical protein n=1 Tax=Flavobacterium gillisiae TaxID=150146 RepID=UPI00115FA36C|nr:hypothetical protein [Flavobacterium gillisiae]
MKTYLKYLISLFLAFGLMVNDCTLDSQSNTAAYDQVSYAQERKDSRNSKTYRYNQITSSEKTSLPIPFAQLQLQDICSLKTRVLLKFRIALHQNISAIKAQQLFLRETITSSNPYFSLYIA